MERVDRFRPHVAALLNVTDDHLDRYENLDAYAHAAAKGNAFLKQTEHEWAVVPFDDAMCIREAKRGRGRILTFGAGGVVDVDRHRDRRSSLGGTASLAPPSRSRGGKYNALNVAAALACVRPLHLPVATLSKRPRGVSRASRTVYVTRR